MPTLRPPQLAARALYVAAVGLLLVVPRLTGDADSPAALVVSLAALLGHGLVAAGLLLEARDRRSGLAAGG